MTNAAPLTPALPPRSLDELEGVIELGLQTFVEVGAALREIRERDLHHDAGFTDFDAYCRKRWGFDRSRSTQLIAAADNVGVVKTFATPTTPLPANDHQARALTPLKGAPEVLAAAWEDAVASAPNGRVTAAHVATVVERYAPTVVLPPRPAPAAPRFYTLTDWAALDDAGRAAVLTGPRDPHHAFNGQTNDSIEWAQWSWNPVTGCRHDCSYCYARDIAARYYEQGFAPAFLPDRLDGPRNTRVPQEKAARDVAFRNVFTCSMADLFGRWVPAAWIEAVLEAVHASPQWNFLFLTKFPIRLQEFAFPDNAWVGTTVDAQARVANAERAFAKVTAKVKWLSCEPLLEPLRFKHLERFDWVVIGGASASTQTPEWRPPWDWHADLYDQARAAGCEVYMKTNLLSRLREYPGQPPAPPIDVPDAFKMPYLQRDVLTPARYAAELAPQGGAR